MDESGVGMKTGTEAMEQMTMPDHRPIASESADQPLTDKEPVGADATFGTSLSAAEIEDVLTDPTLPLAERRARLEGMLGRVGDEEPVERDEAYVPLDMRITDALAMLAEGGHDYAGRALDPELDPEVDESAGVVEDADIR